MVILEDTRQQAGKHANIERYFQKAGITVERCCLYVGDYAIANDQSRAVDTKQDVCEIAKDIMSSDHQRFAAECERAQAAGIKLLVLIEEALPEGGLANWKSKHTTVKGESLKRAMLTMTVKYGVRFRFCDARQAGRLIAEYLAEGVLP
jgi:ERCC4-type nuclease